MRLFFLYVFAASWASLAVSQYFPPVPQGVKILKSKHLTGVNITYKEPGICETTPGVRSYAGYIELPPGLVEGQNYTTSTFFWFFEARHQPESAPLSIWLNGGPGASSMLGLLQENGPCFVGPDSNSTYLNPFSWNNEVNMLYIDQPSHTGFSFSRLQNATLDRTSGKVIFDDFADSVPNQNNTFAVGTLSSQESTTTVNSTMHAAHATWHFLQVWFSEFPAYRTSNDKVSLWTESYGGKLGPVFSGLFVDQNRKILDGSISGEDAFFIHLDTLGIINGCVDCLYQDRAYPEMAFNNTYGIQAFNQTQYEWAIDYFDNHCIEDIVKCQKLAAELDPNDNGDVDKVNQACDIAETCAHKMIGPYGDEGNNAWFDIAHPALDPFPSPTLYGFLSQHWVQAALGVPLNFTPAALDVANAFRRTGDPGRGGLLERLASLLDQGVKVALVYGDRDFACNWIGGERISKAIPYSSKSQFHAAGYQAIHLNDSSVYGQVRQYGNLSFSRVYQAGHQVPSYQPAVSYAIFMRALFDRDIATGYIPVNDNYTTSGPSSTWHIKNELPDFPTPRCYILDLLRTCTDEEIEWLVAGTAIVKEYYVVGKGTSGPGAQIVLN